MSIETELKSKLQQNDYTLSIVEADDLIAAWCYQKTTHSSEVSMHRMCQPITGIPLLPPKMRH